MRRFVTLILIYAFILTACTSQQRHYKIGVSQCSDDIWREKQNSELRMGAYFHRNVELCFAAAYDSDERQVQQIDSLVATGIDLLIVAPNQVATISPAIDRAYDKGIPVIVFERKTNSQKYTAYMGADNYEMGRVMGDYIASRLHGRGKVLEIIGLKGSSPAIERHKGFTEALGKYPQIEIIDTLQGDWTEQSAYQAVKDFQGDLSNVDFVFGHNDRMAVGARKAMEERGLLSSAVSFCGIDGLAGDDGGIRLVRDSILDATYIYPTHGDQLLQMAVNILEEKPYTKEVKLMSALVTRENANVLLLQNEEIIRQSEYVDQLHLQADNYLQQLDTQHVIIIMFIVLVSLLLLLAALLYHYHLQKLRMQEERGKMEREQLDFYTQAAHELRTPLTLIEGPLGQLAETNTIRKADNETAEMFAIVRRNAANLSQLVNKILDVQVGSPDKTLSSEQVDELTLKQQADRMAEGYDAHENNEADLPTLLIVDDNADIRAYLKVVLHTRYRLLEAGDGKEGLLIAHEQVPDLIVSDVMMPVMNGLEFCQQVKADFITSHIPVVLLTARALSKHQIEGYQSGADAYITKPFQAEVLTACISNLLKNRKMLHSLWSSEIQTRQTDEEKIQARPAVQDVEDPFIQRFKKVVEERMADSNLSVEDIGADMHLSRVQLYRKVKAITGCTPVDLLRKARLARAKKLLADTQLSVSEIAYQVGFTTPSYFTKCFKDEYGKVPGEARNE